MKRILDECAANCGTTTELLYECLGLEKLLNRDVMMCIAEKRRVHKEAILSEQRSQREQGICDLERLASVSQESSNWTCTKAHKLAFAYSKLH